MTTIKSVTLIGSGNVATHLGIALKKAGIFIDCVYSKTKENADALAQMLDANYTDKIKDIYSNSDLYIISVSDNAIEKVAKKLNDKLGKSLSVVHTSGVTPSTILSNYFDSYGVLYPLQTFTKNREVDIAKVPFFINSSDSSLEHRLYILALNLSPKVFFLSDEKRKVLHVAAIFTNNFTNFLLSVTEDILKQENIPMNYIYPLITETAAKVTDELSPAKIQTGPAKRHDQNTIDTHSEYLGKYPDYKELYLKITDMIQEKYK